MLNYYYCYCMTWGSVLFFYVLGLSELNKALNPLLLLFFIVSILYAAVMGYRLRSSFRFTDENLPAIPVAIALILIACAIASFLQSGDIPLLNMLRGEYDYEDLINKEASIFHTIAIVGSNFVFIYQLLRLSHRRTRRDLVVLFLSLAVLLAATSRSNLMICGMAALIVVITRRSRKFTLGKTFLIAIIVVTALWLFGAIGNVRSGFDWWDSSYIYLLGYYRGLWPDFLPDQFCWFYSYFTSPLANLNYAVGLTSGSSIDVFNYVYDFIPMMIAKRLPLYEPSNAVLQVPYFNVSSVWSDYFVDGGVVGIFLGFIIQFGLLRFGHSIVRGGRYETLFLVLASVCMIGSFFVNTFVYPTTSYPVCIALALAVWAKLREAPRRHLTSGKSGL